MHPIHILFLLFFLLFVECAEDFRVFMHLHNVLSCIVTSLAGGGISAIVAMRKGVAKAQSNKFTQICLSGECWNGNTIYLF